MAQENMSKDSLDQAMLEKIWEFLDNWNEVMPRTGSEKRIASFRSALLELASDLENAGYVESPAHEPSQPKSR